MENFKERLRLLRKERNMTQKELGELLGVSERNVRFYESGRHYPDFKGLLTLGEYFNVSLDYLVGWSEHRKRR